MTRNNEDRLGVKDEGQNAPVSETAQSPLSFVSPTEFVDLPTGGRFYPEGHPLQGKDTLEIRYMTAKDEDILTSKTLLKKGVAVDRMLQNILVDKSINVDELFIGDKNALVVAARVSGYGPEYKTNVTCPACGASAVHTFDLSDIPVKTSELEEVTITDKGTFTLQLPRTKVNVECRLLTGKDERNMSAAAEKRKKHNLPEAPLTQLLKTIIVSLNGETESEVIEEFIGKMPAMDSKYLRAAYEKVVPNVDMKHLYSCDSCGTDTTLDIPFSVSFFWPDR